VIFRVKTIGSISMDILMGLQWIYKGERYSPCGNFGNALTGIYLKELAARILTDRHPPVAAPFDPL
jgi:hypothetical protein